MDKRKRRKEQTMIYKTLNRKLKIECHQYQGMKSGASEKLAVPSPHVVPVVLLLLQTRGVNITIMNLVCVRKPYLCNY
jgi:hypothetical protein